jgi:hypothetical protein
MDHVGHWDTDLFGSGWSGGGKLYFHIHGGVARVKYVGASNTHHCLNEASVSLSGGL